MVERYLFFRLESALQSADGRQVAVAELHAGLAGPGLKAIRIGVPADAPSEKSWDLSVALAFVNAEDAVAFMADRQPWLDEWVGARAQVVKGWTFRIG